MDISAAAEALMRRKILEDIYDRMSDEEKRLFIQMMMEQKSHSEIMAALQMQQKQLRILGKRQQTFAEEFASNIAGNAVWDGLVWLARRVVKLL